MLNIWTRYPPYPLVAGGFGAEEWHYAVTAGTSTPLSTDIPCFLTTFPFIWGGFASHVCYSVRVP